jgi:thiamine-phosphate pyrophosphorylase
MTALASPLYVICDADACDGAGWSLVDFATACLDGGATLLQIRAKRASSGWLLDCTARIVQRAQAAGEVTVIVNDRADVARLAGATGVHV